jgi:sugar diacid utilization regulator
MGVQSVSTAAERSPAATARKAARLDDAFQAFRGLIEAVEDEGNLSALLEHVSAQACELLSVDRCAVYLLDEESGLYRGHYLRAGARADDRVKRLSCGSDADRFTREILATREPVVIRDARTDPRPIRSAMQRFNVRSMVGVPMVLRGSVLGVLYLDDEGRLRRFTDEDVQVAAAFANLVAIVVANTRATMKLRKTLDTAAKQNASLRRAAIAENRLAELVLDGADFDEIAQSVAQLTGKPCAIYGADGARIGAGGPPGSGERPALLEPADCARPEIAEALAGLRPGTTSVIGPFRAAGFAHRLLISPVAVRGDEWGRIVLMERPTRLTAFDAQVARRAATIIALEISARRRELHSHSTEALVRDLISGIGDDETLSRRAAVQGVALDERHVLCLLSDRDGHGGRSPAVADVVEALDGLVPVLAAPVAEGTVLALRVGDGDGDPVAVARGAIERIIQTTPGGEHWVAALSSAFSGATGFARAYHDVRKVARCLRTFGDNRSARVLGADELGAGCLFLASTTRDEADEFVRHTLGPLLAMGDRQMEDLLSTLALYFASSRNIRETAERIGVHENTIRYRLARIAELTGLDVATNADHQLAGQLATLVLRLEGGLPQHAPPSMASAA